MSWHDDAACRGMPIDMFMYRADAVSAANRRALATCADCPVGDECLEEAIEQGDMVSIRKVPPNDPDRQRRTRDRHHCSEGLTTAEYAEREGVTTHAAWSRVRRGSVEGAHRQFDDGTWCIHV